MAEQRLKIESGPPPHVIADSDIGANSSDEKTATGPAREKAKDVAGSAKDKAQEVTAPAKEKARDVASQAKAHAQVAAGQAKDKAAAQVDERSTQLGQQIGAQSQSLAGVADELRRQGKDGPAKIAEQAGQRIKDAGSYLEQTDGESLVAAAADAARENPAAAAAAGAVVGFAAGRVLKASLGEDSPEEGEAGRPGDGGG